MCLFDSILEHTLMLRCLKLTRVTVILVLRSATLVVVRSFLITCGVHMHTSARCLPTHQLIIRPWQTLCTQHNLVIMNSPKKIKYSIKARMLMVIWTAVIARQGQNIQNDCSVILNAFLIMTYDFLHLKFENLKVRHKWILLSKSKRKILTKLYKISD